MEELTTLVSAMQGNLGTDYARACGRCWPAHAWRAAGFLPSPRTPLRSTPRMGVKCSGALKNTSHLGQKDARDKRARGEAPLRTPLALRKHVRGYWTDILGGNDERALR